MKTMTVTETNSPNEINAVCVDVIDHGVQDTPWGNHPRISLAFETDRKDENGNPKFLIRTFNNYAYSRSALTEAIKNWLGLDISGVNKDYDLEECFGTQATLRAVETVGASGKKYLKIEEINPAGAVCVQASGNYERRDWN